MGVESNRKRRSSFIHSIYLSIKHTFLYGRCYGNKQEITELSPLGTGIVARETRLGLETSRAKQDATEGPNGAIPLEEHTLWPR